MAAERYLMIVVNEITIKQTTYEAYDIVKLLLDNKVWAFSSRGPLVKRISPGDRVVVYLAGKDNRCFVADFSIASEISHANEEAIRSMGDLSRMFPLTCRVSDATIWANKKPIKDILVQLDFIQDKKNYGLYFRQGAKWLNKEDYERIVLAN